MTDHQPIRGVLTAQPGDIHASIKRQVDAAMSVLPAGANGALLAVATEQGINLAVAARIKGDWQVASWIGKGWNGPAAGGVSIRKTW